MQMASANSRRLSVAGDAEFGSREQPDHLARLPDAFGELAAERDVDVRLLGQDELRRGVRGSRLR